MYRRQVARHADQLALRDAGAIGCGATALRDAGAIGCGAPAPDPALGAIVPYRNQPHVDLVSATYGKRNDIQLPWALYVDYFNATGIFE